MAMPLSYSEPNPDLQEAEDLLGRFGARGKRRLAAFLCSIKFPVRHNETHTVFRILEIDKTDFETNPHIFCVKLDEFGERVGDKTRIPIPMAKLISLFYVETYEADCFNDAEISLDIPLLDVVEEFWNDQYKTTVLYNKTEGKNPNNYKIGRGGLGPREHNTWRDSLRKSYKKYNYTPTKPTYGPGSEGYIAPEDREFWFVEFG